VSKLSLPTHTRSTRFFSYDQHKHYSSRVHHNALTLLYRHIPSPRALILIGILIWIGLRRERLKYSHTIQHASMSAVNLSAFLLPVLIYLQKCNLVFLWSSRCHRAPLGHYGCLEETETCSRRWHHPPSNLPDILLGGMCCQKSMPAWVAGSLPSLVVLDYQKSSEAWMW
jgi:hypothetical protein